MSYKNRLPLTQVFSESPISGRNIVVGSYATMHFDAVEGLADVFEKYDDVSSEMELAAEFLDSALSIFKVGIVRNGKLSSLQYEKLERDISAAEELIETFDDLDSHSYINSVLEAAADMLDIDELLDDSDESGESDNDFDDDEDDDDSDDDDDDYFDSEYDKIGT
ncbi:MAG: hypothetical protein DDT26_00301 [Dehalococcoidia bacterium]|nr:hypothetical protein [Chloroflexota bacterium]